MATALKLSAEPKRPNVRMLDIDQLLPTADNLRRRITNGSVESLAKSIAREGLLHPIVVRPHPSEEGKWEIRAGERRWRAAKLAGLAQIPAVVRRLDDEAAMAITITENLQRENLHPLEEGRTIQTALDQGQNPKQLAARLGKSLAFVLRRASLAGLTEAWKDAVFVADSDASRLSVAHLELIARLPSETQDALAADDFAAIFGRGFPTVEELRRIIDDGLHTLASMPWGLNDEGIEPVAGSCLNCPKRSGKQPVLFDHEDLPADGSVSPTDRCLDPSCFDRKHAAYLTSREAALRSDHPNLRLVQVGYQKIGDATTQAVGDRVTRLYQLRVVKKSDPCGTPIMQIDGPKAGALLHADLGDKTQQNGTHATAASATEGGQPGRGTLTLAEREDRLSRRRQAFVVKRVEAMLREFTAEAARKVMGDMAVRSDEAARSFDPLSLVLSFGTTTRFDRCHDEEAWEQFHKRCANDPTDRAVEALMEVVRIWARRLSGTDLKTARAQARDAGSIAAILAIDLAAIELQAEREIPEPSSWKALREQHAVAEAEKPDSTDMPDDAASGDAGSVGLPAPDNEDAKPCSTRSRRSRRKRGKRSRSRS